MDHTPTTPADERALRLLEHADVPAAKRERLLGIVHEAHAAAAKAGAELQAEFGREHVALIVGCNQFVRLFRSGSEPGATELLLDEPGKKRLAQAGFRLREPEGQVFRLFGWVRIDPSEGDAKALDAAVDAAFARAAAGKKPK